MKIILSILTNSSPEINLKSEVISFEASYYGVKYGFKLYSEDCSANKSQHSLFNSKICRQLPFFLAGKFINAAFFFNNIAICVHTHTHKHTFTKQTAVCVVCRVQWLKGNRGADIDYSNSCSNLYWGWKYNIIGIIDSEKKKKKKKKNQEAFLSYRLS